MTFPYSTFKVHLNSDMDVDTAVSRVFSANLFEYHLSVELDKERHIALARIDDDTMLDPFDQMPYNTHKEFIEYLAWHFKAVEISGSINKTPFSFKFTDGNYVCDSDPFAA